MAEHKSNLTTLCYLKQDGKVLMLHRTRKKKDVNKDKWIGVGGHFEASESPEECLLREVREETGYELLSWQFRGIVTFIVRGEEQLTEYMMLFTSEEFVKRGEPESLEGDLVWVEEEKMKELNLWKGDLIFFDLIRSGAPFFSLKLEYDADGTLLLAVLDGQDYRDFSSGI